jgi:hypothetical protein
VPHGKRDGSLRPYSRLSKPEPLLFLPSSSSIVLTKLNGPRSRSITSQKYANRQAFKISSTYPKRCNALLSVSREVRFSSFDAYDTLRPFRELNCRTVYAVKLRDTVLYNATRALAPSYFARKSHCPEQGLMPKLLVTNQPEKAATKEHPH